MFSNSVSVMSEGKLLKGKEYLHGGDVRKSGRWARLSGIISKPTKKKEKTEEEKHLNADDY